MKKIRHAWVIRDDDDASPVYGYYLFDKSGGYVPEIESARLFDTRKAAKAVLSGLDKFYSLVKVEVSIKEIK